nr:(Fe-S)-binding protein [Candidatus Njordarchaeota archaeon]
MQELARRIEEGGSRTTVLSIRKFLLGSGFGAPLERRNADVLVLSGCYIPYSSVEGFSAFVKLLKHFGVNFSFLEKEYCCSEPFLMKVKTKDEKDISERYARDFINRNLTVAKKLGVKRILSVCLGCASMMKQYIPLNPGVELLYYPDLLLELKPNMKYQQKGKLGYFAPCMKHHLAVAPRAGEIDLSPALQLLNSIEGLDYVTFQGKCCVDNTYQAIQEFKKENVQKVVTQCFGCQGYLQGNAIGLRGPHIITLPELVLETLIE